MQAARATLTELLRWAAVDRGMTTEQAMDCIQRLWESPSQNRSLVLMLVYGEAYLELVHQVKPRPDGHC